MGAHSAEAVQDRTCSVWAELAALQALLQCVLQQDGALDTHSHSLAVDGVETRCCVAQHTQTLRQLYLHDMLMRSGPRVEDCTQGGLKNFCAEGSCIHKGIDSTYLLGSQQQKLSTSPEQNLHNLCVEISGCNLTVQCYRRPLPLAACQLGAHALSLTACAALLHFSRCEVQATPDHMSV